MTDGLDPRAQAALALRDATEFIPRLKIVDTMGKVRPFNTPYPEQIELLRAFMGYRRVFVLKSRQVGCGTLRQAYDFHYGYTCQDPVSTIVAAHTEDAVGVHIDRYKQFWNTLPEPLRRKASRENLKELVFDNGTAFRGVTALGVGGGRSFSYQRAHFTELAYWGERAQSAYAGIENALHVGPHFSMCVESTPNGPGNFYAHLAETAMRDPEWMFLFLPWTMNPNYALSIPDPRKFLESLTDEERRLMRQPVMAHTVDGQVALPPMTMEQVAWRRVKVSGAGLMQFRYDYPLTVDEAFASGGSAYFDPDALSSMLFRASRPEVSMRVYEHPTVSKRYVVGVDAGWGAGSDYSVITVLDHFGDQVAVWSDNRTLPHVVGEKAVEIALKYGSALLLIEDNGPGRESLKRASQVGYGKLWTDDKGKSFVTSANQFSSLKMEIFSHARTRMATKPAPVIRDWFTIRELLSIRENGKGGIGGADKKNDDHAMSWVLALWACKRIETFEFDAMGQTMGRFGLTIPRVRRTNPW